MLNHYLKAGSIASEVKKEVKSAVKERTPILQICEMVENGIGKRGGEPAFPCNVCVNEVAAHYSSPPRDTRMIPKGAVVKVDIGVQVEGYIADTAITVSLNPQYENMIFAVNEALEQAIRNIKPKVKINELGRTIKETIEKYGFKPIRNLSGHQMARYVLHTGKSIPNVPTIGFQSINEGEVYAVEPFLTLLSGGGEVRSGDNAYIYRFQKERRVATSDAEKLLSDIKSNFKSLPFSKRWIEGIEEKGMCEAFDELVVQRGISSYPILVEKAGGIVAQAEHTVFVTRDSCLVTTR
jgi:methionyl aminopeptidase